MHRNLSSFQALDDNEKVFSKVNRLSMSGALMTADIGMRLQRGSKWVTVQQGTDHMGTDWLCI